MELCVALTETTAVIFSAVRKGFGRADSDFSEKLTAVHSGIVSKYGASYVNNPSITKRFAIFSLQSFEQYVGKFLTMRHQILLSSQTLTVLSW